jgi:hypothetical protein
MKAIVWGSATVALALSALTPNLANACGCFAAPSPTEQMVQAGERIVFEHRDGKVIAHIQIQYQGDASEFAWLVPVGAVPNLRLGTEELFTQIQVATNPQFLLSLTGNCGSSGSVGCGVSSQDSASRANNVGPGGEPMEPIAVKVASAGPYDYAVLRADEKQPMLDWLAENRFFIPADGMSSMDSYFRPGAYFLALKLRSGESTGDIQPIVLEYEADYPMIPITLTAMGATKDMGVQVWVLGEDRAVSHNYQHVEINEEYIDWLGGGANYAEVVARAIDEAEGGHAFVTEFAGPTDVLKGVLDPDGRFGRQSDIGTLPNLREIEVRLQGAQWPQDRVRSVFKSLYPMPQAAIDAGVSEATYYDDLAYLSQQYDPERAFEPVVIAAAIWERIVEPVLEAGALFRNHPMMTRLYTALDPSEMNKDPVFSFNPDLPQVAQLRTATLETTSCDDDPTFTMHLSDGRSFELESRDEWMTRDRQAAPRTRLVQVMRQEGAAEIIIDNRALLTDLDDGGDGGGCQSSRGDRSRAISLSLMFIFVGLGRQALRRRRR